MMRRTASGLVIVLCERWSHSNGTPQDRGILYSVTVAGKDVWAVGGTTGAFSSPAIILHLRGGHWHVF